MTQVTKFLLTLGALGGTVISPVSVIANPVQTVLVGYSDLDLGNEKDVRMLGRRMSRAIETVCGSYAGESEISEIVRIDKCRKAIREQVAPQMAHLLKRSDIRLSSTTSTQDPK